MIRVTGVLAVVASVVLAILLVARTEKAELVGPVSGPPPGTKPGPAYSPAPPGTDPVYVLIQDKSTNERLGNGGLAGMAYSGSGTSQGDDPMDMYWGFQVPAAAAKAAQSGDELAIRVRSLSLPGMNGSSMKHVRYELRRGSGTQVFGEPANEKFALVFGLIVGAPLVLWGVPAGVVALFGMMRKVQPAV